MDCKDRAGNIISANEGQDKVLQKLYQTKAGRGLLKVLIKPSVSKAGGWVLNRKISKVAINSFIKSNKIDLAEYEDKRFSSYNDFFMRKIKDGKRPVDMDSQHFVSPCDSKLSVYKIEDNSTFLIKDTEYSIESLTRSKKLMDKYKNGYFMIFRLTVDDYHRYCYVDNGEKGKNYWIDGVFHTVNPLANDEFPIYKENTRCFSFLRSENFGTLMMMEVGALMVGRIVNYHERATVTKGMEKGRFEFGGSTVIIAVKEGMVKLDQDILDNSLQGIETKVKYGEKIGIKG